MFIRSYDQTEHIDALAITYLSKTQDANEPGKYYVEAYVSAMDLSITLLNQCSEKEADALIRRIEQFKDSATGRR